MYESVTPMPEMMARVDSITSVMMDIEIISNCGFRISNCYARAAFAVLKSRNPQSEFRNSQVSYTVSISRSQPADDDRPNQADQNQHDYDRYDDPGPALAPGSGHGGHGLLDLRELILRRIPGRFASQPAVTLR